MAAFHLPRGFKLLCASACYAPRPTNCRAPSSATTGPIVQQHIFDGLAKEMIRGSVRMIDDPAQSTGLVVKVDDQRPELCFGNRIYKIHTLRSYVWLMRTLALRLGQRQASQ